MVGTGFGKCFPSLVHLPPPGVTCHSLWGSRHPGEAGMHQTGKEQEGSGEDILTRGSGPAHTPPKSFLHGKLVKYPSHQLPPHFPTVILHWKGGSKEA